MLNACHHPAPWQTLGDRNETPVWIWTNSTEFAKADMFRRAFWNGVLLKKNGSCNDRICREHFELEPWSFLSNCRLRSSEDGTMGILLGMMHPDAKSGVLYGPKKGGTCHVWYALLLHQCVGLGKIICMKARRVTNGILLSNTHAKMSCIISSYQRSIMRIGPGRFIALQVWKKSYDAAFSRCTVLVAPVSSPIIVWW